MNKIVPALSRAMLIVGGLMILAGLGWGIWVRVRVQAAPEPVIGEAGAVVLAVTAPELAQLQTPSPEPTATASPVPTRTPQTQGPTPDLLPDWTVAPAQPEATPTATSPPPTTIPPTASPTPQPTPTPLPAAQSPPVRIVAPAIELDAKVVPMGWDWVDKDGAMVSEWVVPAKAAGWHMNSALPGHGENVVLSGHHNIEGKVFRYVVDLQPGDRLTLYTDEVAYEYIVTEKYILKEVGMPLSVRRKNAQWIMPTGDERLTLVTCWPYEWPGNTHRVIVVARPPSYFEALEQESQERGVE